MFGGNALDDLHVRTHQHKCSLADDLLAPPHPLRQKGLCFDVITVSAPRTMGYRGLLVSILSLHIVSSVGVFEPDRRERPGPDDYGRESFRGLRSPEATEDTHSVSCAHVYRG